MSSKHVINALGYAGLLPFIVPASMIVYGSGHTPLLMELVGAYAFGIICFLTGSWWGLGLTSGSRVVLSLSNFYFLIGFFIFVFAAQVWTLTAAVLLFCIFLTEKISSLFPEFPAGYRTMRAVLTLGAGISMLTTFFAA